MAYTIVTAVQGQPVSSALFGNAVKAAINDLDSRVAAIEGDTQKLVARMQRVTTKTVAAASAGTEFGFMRIDNIPVRAGKAYRIMTSSINLDTDVAEDAMQARVRIAYSATTGTLATTASQQYGQMRQVQHNIGFSLLIPLSAFYFAAADGYISVLLTGIRATGTGNLQFFANAGEIFDLTVEYAGTDPGSAGTAL
jgi:hypothetical protein